MTSTAIEEGIIIIDMMIFRNFIFQNHLQTL
jgi:hypothetical protein